MEPICFERGFGSRIYDLDGNGYIDYILALGPLILGHCPLKVVEAVKNQTELGSIFGAAAAGEERLAKMVCNFLPSVDLVSFTNSASEAVHMALRLARAFTGKTKIVKFEGCYHGWVEDVMYSIHPESPKIMGPENNPQPVPESMGLSESIQANIIIAPWNQPDVLEKIFRRQGNEIAAIIIEPIPANNGVIPPHTGFLEFLRELTLLYETVFIFDETITGFRVNLGGAQAYYNIRPDLTIFGKAVGGGYPIAGFGGNKEVMDFITRGEVIRMGTYNSNSICVAAATAVLEELSRDNSMAINRMIATGERLIEGLREIFAAHNFPLNIQGLGPLFSTFFSDEPINTYRDTFKVNSGLYQRFWSSLLKKGVRIIYSSRATWLLSAAHTKEDIEETLQKVEDTLEELKKR
jgi:glutamate-1-semialdehyde 2,1-aminomutase